MSLDTILARLQAPPPDTYTWRAPRDGLEMIIIPAGVARLGSPIRQVPLPAYSLARFPVTNHQYQRFLQESGYRPDPTHPDADRFLCHWTDGAPTAEQRDHPVVWVSWWDACAYCGWAGLVLPSEAWWERAARGPQGHLYPWGDTYPTPKRTQIQQRTTAPVGAFPDTRTASGCEDMIGNVSEWCLPLTPPTTPALPATAPIRGSAYMRVDRGGDRMACAHQRVLSATRRNHYTGFRPASPLTAPPEDLR